MSGIIRVHALDADARAVLVLAGPEVAYVMGKLREARYDRDRRAFVMPADLVDRLSGIAAERDVVVIDERASHRPAPAPVTKSAHEMPWCTQCDERTRQVDVSADQDGTRISRCPRCHDLRAQMLPQTGAPWKATREPTTADRDANARGADRVRQAVRAARAGAVVGELVPPEQQSLALDEWLSQQQQLDDEP